MRRALFGFRTVVTESGPSCRSPPSRYGLSSKLSGDRCLLGGLETGGESKNCGKADGRVLGGVEMGGESKNFGKIRLRCLLGLWGLPWGLCLLVTGEYRRIFINPFALDTSPRCNESMVAGSPERCGGKAVGIHTVICAATAADAAPCQSYQCVASDYEALSNRILASSTGVSRLSTEQASCHCGRVQKSRADL